MTDSLDDLVRRAERLASVGSRRVLGITGPPGAGKSTLSRAVVTALGPQRAVLVPMDGFHRSAEELDASGLTDVKGAPDTFDAAGFVALLRTLRAGRLDARAPVFDRAAERTVPDAVAIARSVPLVVTEGNYLLVDEGPWAELRGLLDEIWYVDVPDETRHPELIARHIAYGKSPAAATEWVLRSDEANARLVTATRDRADLVVRRPPMQPPH